MGIRLNAYRIMWIFVFFDLPTNSKLEKKNAQGFRQKLLNDGFSMMQYSIYIRHCPSYENAQVHINRTKKNLPPTGKVSILTITDKQFGLIENFMGIKKQKAKNSLFAQLELF